MNRAEDYIAPQDTRFHELPGGRRLCYAEYGLPTGRPVFYFHGFPSSRLEAAIVATAACHHGVRLIAVDRPGFGGSSFQHGRRINDFPADIAALADHLDIQRFGLIAISGGGPYAIACAAQLNSRVDKLSLVCALGSFEYPQSTRGMHFPLNAAVRFARTMPAFSHLVYKNIMGRALGRFPKLLLLAYLNLLTGAEHAVFRDRVFLETISVAVREGFRQGGAGAAWEMRLITTPWDIDPGKINAETWLWHGEDDTVVPPSHSRRHNEQIPNSRATFLPNEGHFSLPYRHIDIIMDQFA